MIREYERSGLEIIYTVEDILKHYSLGHEIPNLVKRLGALPFDARVPEGEENEYASRIRNVLEIKAGLPDFTILPTGEASKLTRPS